MASCVPRLVLNNLLDCPTSQRSERERLVRNIGIQTRRISFEWQCFSDLAFVATEKLLDDLQWKREEIDALIVVTQSPDYPIPATAIILQDRLGLAHSTIAFDVNLGCSGYPFGLHLLGSMIAAGGVKKALLLVGDKSATIKDPLFSDAGTATALQYDASAPPIHFDLNSDGSGYRAIMLPVGGHREPFGMQHMIPTRDAHGHKVYPGDLFLDGPAVLSFSTQRVPPAVERLLHYAQVEKEQIDYFIFHQANRMINETIRKKLGLPVEKVPSTLPDLGNTSGASLPVTMTARLHETLQAPGRRKLLLSGFGVGLSWGTAIVDIEGAKFPAMLEA
jgi:3-oxoacyl-[acyl-carrier-protein] synthase-3